MANRITTTFSFKEEGRGLQKIKADVEGVDGAWNKARTGFKSAAAEFKNSGAAQAIAAGALLKVASDAVDAASALEESANAMSVTYGEASDDIADLANDAAEKYGLSKRAFNELSVAFSGFASQIVGEGGDISETVDDMATRVADFASVHNLEVAEAMTKFQSALAGETEAMRRYGIDVSAAAVEQYAFANGLAESKSELTESIKVQARYGLLMRETNQWAGDFANTSDGLANSQRVLAANVENLQAQLGEHLVPALAETTSNLNDLLSVAEKLRLVDLGAEFAKWVDPSPLGAVKRLRALQESATDAKFLLSEFDGTVDELRETLEGLGYDTGEIDKAVEHYADTLGEGKEAQEEAAAAADEFARSLRENAREATYNADANQEMGRIHRATTKAVDAARAAQEAFLKSIRHTRDEVGALNREIDDRSALLNLQDAFDSTREKIDDTSASAREQEQAILDLKSRIIDYAESLNLPDKVVTQLLAQIDAGGVAAVEAMLVRWGNGVTLPIRPLVISTGGGSRVRVDEHGNVRAAASGTSHAPGGLTVVGERGPELVDMPRGARVRSAVETITDSRGGGGGTVVASGPTINLTVNAGMGTDGADVGRRIVEELRKFERFNGPGWRS